MMDLVKWALSETAVMTLWKKSNYWIDKINTDGIQLYL